MQCLPLSVSIYSLGVVAYQCLAGHVPYDGEDSFSIGYKHITEPLPLPTLGSADERRLFEVVRRMLAGEAVQQDGSGLSKREWGELMETLGR